MSKIISFSWTTPALLADRKHATRRNWQYEYAVRFKINEVCQAWDHLPRTGKGKKVADIRLTDYPRYQMLADMPDSDYEEEGFAFFEEHPELLAEKSGPIGMSRDYFDNWKLDGGGMWVVRFKLEEVYQ